MRQFICFHFFVVSVASGISIPASADTITGLLHHWQFDEASGNIAVDSVSGNNGTLNNWGPSEPSWVAGKIGGALDFGDTNNYVVTDSPISHDEYTIAFWLKVHTEEGVNPRVVGPVDGRFHWILIGNEDDRGVGFYYDWGNILAQDPNPPILGVWEHYAVVYDRAGNDVVIYRDGSEIAHESFTDG